MIRILDDGWKRLDHHGGLHFLHVARHAGHDVALALVGEESDGKSHDLVVHFAAYVAHPPFCIGMVKNSDRYPADTLGRVITTSVTQAWRVNDAPSARTIPIRTSKIVDHRLLETCRSPRA